ncbi:hypothetical protein RAS1_21540 [Phycisphaerae bacterium RAS1]|nr:hypothetical protein RAS1_21540 [Phycisphaerae bacterium RAS1]
MSSVFVWTPLLILLGLVGFFVVALLAIVKMLGIVFRGIGGCGTRLTHAPAPPLSTGLSGVLCPHPRCGQANPRQARYCARCGRPLHGDAGPVSDRSYGPHDVNTYG